jgi:hypothetical protein
MTSTCPSQSVDLVFNNSMCEAVGCFEKATIEIAVKVGEHRTINLLLCKNCVPKFEEDNNSHFTISSVDNTLDYNEASQNE